MKPPRLIQRPKPGVCANAGCRNKVNGGITLCSTCRSQKSRLADPVKYAYYNLKNRAKQRNIVFTITIQQFREFCHKTRYMAGKGRTADSYTIDRKHEDIGYHADNIQVLAKKDNVVKYYLNYDWRTKEAIIWKPVDDVKDGTDPF